MDTVEVSPVLGSFRRFGASGPVYQVIGYGRRDKNHGQWMQIHIFDSDEDVEYKLDDLLDDPQAD